MCENEATSVYQSISGNVFWQSLEGRAGAIFDGVKRVFPFMVEIGGKCVGCLLLIPLDLFDGQGDVASIMYIRSLEQDTGHGTAMVKLLC